MKQAQKQQKRFPIEFWLIVLIVGGAISTKIRWEKVSEINQMIIAIALILLATFLLTVCSIQIFKLTRSMYYRYRARKEVRYMEIYPSTDIQLEPGKVLRFVQDFANMQRVGREYWKKGKPYFRLHIAWPVDAEEKTGPIRMYLGYPQDRESGVKHTLKSVYPTARYRSISHDDFRKVIKQKGDGKGGYFVFTGGRRKGLPLKAFEKESHLGSILADRKSVV